MSNNAVANYLIDIEKPRYDQSEYWGRAKHFFITVNPLNVLKTDKELEDAKSLVQMYRSRQPLPPDLTENQLWRAKQTYDSAFHPETGEKMFLPGRMSFQVPGNMMIVGCMLQFHKHPASVLFWQWCNQSFNAAVNYTNRSGKSPVSKQRLLTSYLLATGGAVFTALSIGRSRFAAQNPLIKRLVPFVAVAAANCINIPSMRSQELSHGLDVKARLIEQTEEGTSREVECVIGKSRRVAALALGQVVVSRILMSVPGLVVPPIMMTWLEKKAWMRRRPWIGLPIQIVACGVLLTFATPMCCALFPQNGFVSISFLEPECQATIKKDFPELSKTSDSIVFYNKGL